MVVTFRFLESSKLKQLRDKYPIAIKVWAWNCAQAGAKIFREIVPVKSGGLKRSIKAVKVGDGSYGVEASKVFDFVDKGTKPHIILPRYKSVLKFAWAVQGGRICFFKRVHHPGSKAQGLTQKASLSIQGFAATSINTVMRGLGF